MCDACVFVYYVLGIVKCVYSCVFMHVGVHYLNSNGCLL